MPKQEITLVWKAHRRDPEGKDASLTFPLYSADLTSDIEVLELLFKQTNLYEGHIWDEVIQPNLPEDRGHTALSVGDEVGIDGVWWRCEDIGWSYFEKPKTAEEVALDEAYEDGFNAGWKACLEALANTPRPTPTR